MMNQINLKTGYIARKAIAPVIIKTPLLFSKTLSTKFQQPVFFKPEMLQPTGSFKLRGATNKIAKLIEQNNCRGVVAVSTGNHGCAVAHAAQQFNIPAYIYLSNNVPKNKIDNIKQYGAEIVIKGDSQDEAEAAAKALAQQENFTFIHPFDDLDIIAGQGTIALELLEQLPKLQTIVVPLSGGGLISGIAAFAKQINPDIEIIGVSMDQGAVMHTSLDAGKPVSMPENETLADSLQGGIGLDNRYTFNLVRHYVDQTLLVTEQSILNAIRFMLHTHKMLLEGAAVVGIAALLENQLTLTGSTVFVLTGQNLSSQILKKLA